MKELLKKTLPVIPADISRKLARSGITLPLFENKNCDGVLQQELGYKQFPDGSCSAMYIPRKELEE